MPVVHSKANGQFVKQQNAATANTKANPTAAPGGTNVRKTATAKPTALQAANISAGLDPNHKAKAVKKKAAGKKVAGHATSGASAAKTAANAKKDAARAARQKAAKAKFAASQHRKAVHKAVMAKRHVLALEKKARLHPTAANVAAAKSAKASFTKANTAYHANRVAAKKAQSAFESRHLPKNPGGGSGSVGGAVKAASKIKSAPKVATVGGLTVALKHKPAAHHGTKVAAKPVAINKRGRF